jgi:hypothetical protein
MAGGANFYGDVALVRGTGDERVSTGAVDADFGVIGMNSWFHVDS